MMGYDDLATKKGLVLVGLVVVSIFQVLGAAGVRPSKMVPAMYVFGDSTLDIGNNNCLPGENVPRANMPFYGIDYPGSRPTGRFSNGYNVADFIAKSLGFKESPPAYLSLSPRTVRLVLSALSRGVSYASAGSGVLDSTNAGKNIPLSKQVRYFVSTKAEMDAKVGTRAVRALLSRSFFLLGVGSNDLFQFAIASHNMSAAATRHRDVAALYTDLISNYSATITELYEMGARKFGIINVGLLGCVPTVRVQSANGACNGDLNQLAAGFDGALGSLMRSLAAALPGLAYSLADSYNLSQATFANPEASGYVSIEGACCGGGRMGAEGDCLPNSTVCAHRDSFVFWDRVHPSQRAGKLSAAAFYDGPAQYTEPISFKQLAQTRIAN